MLSHVGFVVGHWSTCKVVRITSREVQQEIFQRLVYKKKTRGRTLSKQVKSCGLRAGDRLEPSVAIPDVAMFETMTLPFTADFWRMADNSKLVHENPVLVLVPGVDVQSYRDDVLHAWVLGPLQSQVARCFNLFLRSHVLCPASALLDADEKRRIGLLKLKAKLFVFNQSKRDTTKAWHQKTSEAGSVI